MDYHIFKHPYVLIEDENGKCRPLHREYTGEGKEAQVPMLSYEKAGSRQKSQRKGKKAGVCELCLACFSDYEGHIADPLHSESVNEHIDYNELDLLIGTLGRQRRVEEKGGRGLRSKRRLFAESGKRPAK
jgi:DBF zinc finger